MIFASSSLARASAALLPVLLATLPTGTSALATRNWGPSACPLDNAVLEFTKEANLTVPAGLTLRYLVTGRGTQNYTCSSNTSTYTNNVAQAILFDASCLAQLPFQLALAPSYALAGPDPVHPNLFNLSADQSKQMVINEIAGLIVNNNPPPKELGQHFFTLLPGAAAPNPEFNFVSSTGDPNQFTIDAKVSNLPAPVNPTVNVDWLNLAPIPGQAGGQAAKAVFRVDTAGGQPPKTCDPNDPKQKILLVQYAANYYFFD